MSPPSRRSSTDRKLRAQQLEGVAFRRSKTRSIAIAAPFNSDNPA